MKFDLGQKVKILDHALSDSRKKDGLRGGIGEITSMIQNSHELRVKEPQYRVLGELWYEGDLEAVEEIKPGDWVECGGYNWIFIEKDKDRDVHLARLASSGLTVTEFCSAKHIKKVSKGGWIFDDLVLEQDSD